MRLLSRLKRIAGLERRPFQESAFSIARRWSNRELRKFAGLFPGNVVNVSAWEDRDKEGRQYREYFTAADRYYITNFGTSQGTMQYQDNEIFLDLEADLDPELQQHFAAVFNHTTLEHVWNFRKAFASICAISSDIVIIVLPWLQPAHADYGDYWRFSPQAVVRMFDEQGFTTLYLSWGSEAASSVYVFAIASREPERWRLHFPDWPINSRDPAFTTLPVQFAGAHAFD